MGELCDLFSLPSLALMRKCDFFSLMKSSNFSSSVDGEQSSSYSIDTKQLQLSVVIGSWDSKRLSNHGELLIG